MVEELLKIIKKDYKESVTFFYNNEDEYDIFIDGIFFGVTFKDGAKGDAKSFYEDYLKNDLLYYWQNRDNYIEIEHYYSEKINKTEEDKNGSKKLHSKRSGDRKRRKR